MEIVAAVKRLKGMLALLVRPAQEGHVDLVQANRDAYEAYVALHNLLADRSFLFSPETERRLLELRSKLSAIQSRASTIVREAERGGKSPSAYPSYSRLWEEMQSEVNPLEATIIEEIRSLLEIPQ